MVGCLQRWLWPPHPILQTRPDDQDYQQDDQDDQDDHDDQDDQDDHDDHDDQYVGKKR